MIVKNESHIILETLNNVKKYIDYWVISDTGSTDGTQEIITNFFKKENIPGKLVSHKWKDFGHNRTLALEACRGKCDYIFVMDADDIIVGDLKLPQDFKYDGYKLLYGKNFSYDRLQIMRNKGLKWEYVGVLHEYARCKNKKNASITTIRGDYYIDSRRLGDRNKDKNKYLKDALILRAELEKLQKKNGSSASLSGSNENSLVSRYAFYTGQSYYDYKDYENAIIFYRMRIKYLGWNEEVYYSYYQVANSIRFLKKDLETCEKAYLDAYNYLPSRAEALYQIASIYSDEANNLLDDDNYDIELYDKYMNKAYKYFSMANKIPYPERQTLFIFKEIYDWKAKYGLAMICFEMEKNDEALKLCNELIDNESCSKLVEKLKYDIVCENFDTYIHYDKRRINLINSLKKDNLNVVIVIFFKDLYQFSKTINSLINCCTDIFLVKKWILIIDTNNIDETMNNILDDLCEDSSKDIGEKIKILYPFFQIQMENDIDYDKKMSILKNISEDYVLLLDNDWQFVEKKDYIKPCLEIFETDDKIGQVLFNKNYMTKNTIIIGGHEKKTKSGLKYIIHEYFDEKSDEYKSIMEKYKNNYTNIHWPHFSSRPSLINKKIFNEINFINLDDYKFGLIYSKKYVSAFLESLSTIRNDYKKKDSENNSNENDIIPKIKDYKKMYGNYIFIPHLDSFGNDIKHVENTNVFDLSEIANSNEKCVGFNTYGYLKHKINPINQLIKLESKYNSVEGLYIKKSYVMDNYHKKLDNYIFYPGSDSFGNDLFYHKEKTIDELKAIADNEPNCVAFNTYGYFKNKITKPKKFITIRNINHDRIDGLYVKIKN
jgi:Glycosyltransferases involved in cell wall biogenesis